MAKESFRYDQCVGAYLFFWKRRKGNYMSKPTNKVFSKKDMEKAEEKRELIV